MTTISGTIDEGKGEELLQYEIEQTIKCRLCGFICGAIELAHHKTAVKVHVIGFWAQTSSPLLEH